MRTIHAVAVESDTSGAVYWYTDEPRARLKFDAAVATIAYAGHDINRFSFEVPDDMTTPAEITKIADDRMWHLDYTPIERRAATEGNDIFLPAKAQCKCVTGPEWSGSPNPANPDKEWVCDDCARVIPAN